MTQKMAYTCFILGVDPGFSHIVEQGGPTQGKLSGNTFHHKGGMPVDIIKVVGVVLIKAHSGFEFRDHLGDDGCGPDEILCLVFISSEFFLVHSKCIIITYNNSFVIYSLKI